MSSTILEILGLEVVGVGGDVDVDAAGAAVARERAKVDEEPNKLCKRVV